MTEIRKTKAYFRRLAATRGVSWRRVEAEYNRWREQDRADRLQDERLRRRVWDHYRGDRPWHQWRTGIKRLFRHEFTDGDYSTIKGWDTLARELANEFPDLIGPPAGYNERIDFEPDWSENLFEYLKRPPLKRPPVDEVVEGIIERFAQSSHVPDTSFDPVVIDSTPNKLELVRQNATHPKRERQMGPAAGYIEFPSNIAALCMTDAEARQTHPLICRNENGELVLSADVQGQREGAKFVQVTPTDDPDTVYATATNGKAVAIVQCRGRIDQSRLCPAPVAPKAGAKPSSPLVTILDRDRWTNSKGIQAGRVADGLVEFPVLKVGVDSKAEPFCLDVDDIVRLAKALGTKRLGFYPAPGDANDAPKLIAVLPMDPESVVGAGMLVSQDSHLPSAQEFSDAVGMMLGMGPMEADKSDWQENASPLEPTDKSSDDALDTFLASL